MAKRQTLIQELRPDLMALFALAILGLLGWAHQSPIFIGTSDPTVVGAAPPPSPKACDTLLVLPDPPEEGAEAATFSALDMAYGWYNTLGQEIGCFQHAWPSQLEATSWTGVRTVVVASSAARTMRQDLVDSLGRWVEQGGVLLVEQPDARWTSTTGLPVTTTGARVTRSITSADRAPIRGALRDTLLETPVTTTMLTAELGADQGGAEPTSFLEVDGRPALLHAARGAGHAYVLTIDLARAITTLQQGRPLDDFSLPPPESEQVPPGLTQPWVLVADKKMLNTEVPFADLLERLVVEVITIHTPTPRLWYYPGTAMGVFIMSHDEEAFGDRSAFVTDWESANGLRSTNFIIPDSMSSEALAKMLEQGHDVQVHWNRGFDNSPQSRRAGLGPWRPLALEMSLIDQQAAIQAPLEDHKVTLNRTHGLLWDSDWSESFQKMAAAGIVADSTYGPTGPKQFGYLFGTGRPFYALDRGGQLLPILEIPFVMQDDENLDAARLRKLILDSEGGHHQVIMPIFHTNTMANRPDVEVMHTWRRTFAFAERHNHWVTTLRDFLLFEEARRTSIFSSRFIEGERRLEIAIDAQAPRIEAEASAGEAPALPAPSLTFPQNYKGNGVEEVNVDGVKQSMKRLGRSGDGFYHILPLAPGRHIIHVVYGGRTVEAITPEE